MGAKTCEVLKKASDKVSDQEESVDGCVKRGEPAEIFPNSRMRCSFRDVDADAEGFTE